MMPGWFACLLSRIRGLFGQAGAERELNEEIEAHVELLAERFVCRGMSRREAAFAARRQFGNTTLLKQRHREGARFLAGHRAAGYRFCHSRSCQTPRHLWCHVGGGIATS